MPRYKVWFNLGGEDEEEHIDTTFAIEFVVAENDSHGYNKTPYERVSNAAIVLAEKLGLSMTWDIDEI